MENSIRDELMAIDRKLKRSQRMVIVSDMAGGSDGGPTVKVELWLGAGYFTGCLLVGDDSAGNRTMLELPPEEGVRRFLAGDYPRTSEERCPSPPE